MGVDPNAAGDVEIVNAGREISGSNTIYTFSNVTSLHLVANFCITASVEPLWRQAPT